jgi:hypothetical protein
MSGLVRRAEVSVHAAVVPHVVERDRLVAGWRGQGRITGPTTTRAFAALPSRETP